VAVRQKSLCQAWQIVDSIQMTCDSLFLASMSNLVHDNPHSFSFDFKELVLLAVLTTSSLLSKTSNSVRSLCVCVKHSLVPLSAMISILSWVLCVLHFTQFDKLEEHLLQKCSTLLSRLLKLLHSCNFLFLVRVQTVKLVDTNLL
jgi:hypothetical protein